MKNEEFQKALLQAFSEEAPELIRKIEGGLLELEQSESDSIDEIINSIKRPLHSLKGSTSVIDRGDLSEICHRMEEVILNVSPSDITADTLDRFHKALTFISESSKRPTEKVDISEILDTLGDAGKESNIEAEASAEKHTNNPNDVDLSDVAETQEAVAVNQLTDSNNPSADKETGTVHEPILTETIRVATNKIENIQSSVGEIVAIRLQQEDSLSSLSEIQTIINKLGLEWRSVLADINAANKATKESRSNKLDAKLVNVSSALKSLQRKSYQLSNQMSNQNSQLTLLSDEMDDGLRAVRMMPMAPFLESYRMTARDAARSVGKAVSLNCDKAGIEVDRLILEQIKEPLLHIIRNCVSHGIETPDERLALGKAEVGEITVTAELNGDMVILKVQDDGSGFNKEKIYQKAFNTGLVKSINEITNEKVLELICMPGFSTADQADKVSGRGVGMDVVATMIAELGGSISVESELNKGSEFTIQVPSSLATTQGLILQVGTQKFGIILDMVERIVRMTVDSLDTVESKKVLYVDSDPIAVTSLAGILDMREFEPDRIDVSYPIVILKAGNQRLAMIVDDIPGEIPIIVKPLGSQFNNIKIYSGGSILSDGSILPVIEARQVINLVSNSSTYRLSEFSNNHDGDTNETNESVSDSNGSILVVDDSITTRTLERNILEAAGYDVRVATDGIEALDILAVEDDISMVVTDLEMPRMNGLELCQNIRKGRHASLPIIMVTSVGNDAEKQKGLEAGADSYIVKGNFQQDHFLGTVRRFVNAG